MTPTMADVAEMLWITLANVSDGDWTKQSRFWQDAAHRNRDYYLKAVEEVQKNPLQAELLDLITLMPDSQTQEIVDYITDLRAIRARHKESSRG